MIDAGPNSTSHLARSPICLSHGVSTLRPRLQLNPGDLRDRSVGSLGAGLPKTGTFDTTHASDTNAEFGRSERPTSWSRRRWKIAGESRTKEVSLAPVIVGLGW